MNRLSRRHFIANASTFGAGLVLPDTLLPNFKEGDQRLGVEQLQKWEGGEGVNVKGMQLFLAPSADDRHLYEAAVFFDAPEKFKDEEIQRIADDYAIDLPPEWNLNLLFVESLPAEAIKSKDLPVALHVSTKKQPVLTSLTTAYVRIINGEAEKEIYVLNSKGGKVCIGREKKSADR